MAHTFTVTTTPVVMGRFRNLLALMEAGCRSGRSGHFGMWLDGDGSERPFKVDPPIPDDIAQQAMRNSRRDVEIAYAGDFGSKNFRKANDELVTETFTVEAGDEVWSKFRGLLAMLSTSASIGHTGHFAIPLDGDGADTFKLTDSEGSAANALSGDKGHDLLMPHDDKPGCHGRDLVASAYLRRLARTSPTKSLPVKVPVQHLLFREQWYGITLKPDRMTLPGQAKVLKTHDPKGNRLRKPEVVRINQSWLRQMATLRHAAEVGTDSATIYAIAPEMLAKMIEATDWLEKWDNNPADEHLEKMVRQHGGAVFHTGGDGFWDVKIPTPEGYLPIADEKGYMAPYGKPKKKTKS